MIERRPGGSAGDAHYGALGIGYTAYRQPEPAIAVRILSALGQARHVLNVGAGAGSYEPLDRVVTAVEPSPIMRAQRPPHLATAIDAVAQQLPFPDHHFDATMATFTVHQWSALDAGLAEIHRVTAGPVLILTCDPSLVEKFSLNDYAPMVLAVEARRYPALDRIANRLGGEVEIESVAISPNCRDGFNEAYYGRPERLLEPPTRRACSAWSFVDSATSRGYIDHLRQSLADGSWGARYGRLRTQPSHDGSLRLIVARR